MTCIQQPSLFKCHCFVIPKLANWTVSSSHLCLKVSIFRLFWLQMLILLVNSPVFSSHFPLQAYIFCDSNVHFNSKCISIEHLSSNIIFTLPLHWPRKKGSTVAWSPWWLGMMVVEGVIKSSWLKVKVAISSQVSQILHKTSYLVLDLTVHHIGWCVL